MRIPGRLGGRDLFVLTVPLAALALYVVGAACLDYHRMRQFDDWWSNQSSVRKFAYYRLRSALRLPAALGLLEDVSAPDPDALHLEVDRAAWRELHSDVQGRWGQRVEGLLVDNGRYHEVELRLRGDTSVHWTGEKKSLGIETGRDDLYRGMRRMNVSVKAVLPSYFSNSLAADFGVLAPETHVLPIFVNERFYGLFRMIEPIDESFLRRRALMPGNVFQGDADTNGEIFRELQRQLFLNPYVWDRAAKNDRPGAAGTSGLLDFVAGLNGSSFEDHLRFMARLDREELAHFLALMLVCGDLYHMSGTHNQYWYEDPATGTLHPIVWDLLLRLLHVPEGRFGIHRFWATALNDPRLWARALEITAERSADGALFELARERVESVYERYHPHFQYEHLREGPIHDVGRPPRILTMFARNLEELESWRADSRVAGRSDPVAAGLHTLDLLSSGRAPSELRGLELVAERAARLTLIADTNLDGRPDDGDRPVQAASVPAGRTRVELERAERLLPGCKVRGLELADEALHYRYFLRLEDSDGAPVEAREIRPALFGRFSAEPLAPAPLERGAPLPETQSWHPWSYERPPGEVVRLAGEVRLDRDLVIPEGSSLELAAGTRLRLAPDVSILVRGQLVAEGEAGAPVVVEAADELLPWGVLALQGPGADGSALRHAHVSGGGGALLEGVEYKGMVSVHEARGVVFERCTLERNLRCDDLLNAVRAEVDLLGCTFRSGNADAVDYDLSRGRIVDCLIEGANNDGIDLMTCSPLISGTRIVGSGDKGISVGEDSAPTVIDCEISGCARGLEVKDFSSPRIVGTRVSQCGVGVLARQKNWRYGGAGHPLLIGSVLEHNGLDHQELDGARLSVLGSRLDGLDAEAPLPGWALACFDPERSGAVSHELAFREQVGDGAMGWRALGDARSVCVRGRDLSASLDGRPGGFGTEIEWELAPGARHFLVLEVAGAGLREARALVAGPRGSFERTLELDPDPARFRYTALELAPGRYGELGLVAEPLAQPGRLLLHTARVVSLPEEEP